MHSERTAARPTKPRARSTPHKPANATLPSSPTAKPDRRKLKKTSTPGVYRKGHRYIVMYWVGGRQHKESAATLEQARALKRSRETDGDRGEFQAQTKTTLHEYAREWIERYQGNGRRGFRENTRIEYRRLLDVYAFEYFPPRFRLTDLTPRHVAGYVGWLADENEQGKRLSDSSIRNILNPIRAMLATAVREGLLRHNPATGLALPRRDDGIVDEEDEVRTLTREQLRRFLDVVAPEHHVLFTVLAGTGLRISEAIGLRWRDLYLEQNEPYLRVRRALVKGRVEPPKTKYGRRRVPFSSDLAALLGAHRTRTAEEIPEDEDWVFTSSVGTPLDPDNLRRRVLNPATKKVGASWAGYHAFRHTYASLMLASGANLLQLSRALGHHSPAFTLAVYTHLLQGEHAPALDLNLELGPTQRISPDTAPPRVDVPEQQGATLCLVS